MPQESKTSQSGKQKRRADHSEKGYEKKSVSKKEAKERAGRTVNKKAGGGEKKTASSRR